MPFVRTSHLEQYYDEQGRGDPVLFLHEYFGTFASWQAQRDTLSRYYRAVAVDLRGHGRTLYPGGRLAIDDLRDDVAELMETLGLAPVHLVGSSLGAFVALRLAAQRPQLVRTVIAVGVPQVGEPSALGYADRFIAEVFPANEEHFDRQHAGHPPGHAREVLLREFALDRGGYPEEMSQAVEGAGAIDCPALVIAGDNDPVFPVASAVRLTGLLPRGELCVLPRAGHFPQRTLPTIFSAVVLDFLFRASR